MSQPYSGSIPGTPPRHPTPSGLSSTTLRQASSPLAISSTTLSPPSTPTTANQIRSFSDAALAVTQTKRSSIHGSGITGVASASGIPGTPPPRVASPGSGGVGGVSRARARDLLRKHYGLGVGPPPSMQGKAVDPMDLGVLACFTFTLFASSFFFLFGFTCLCARTCGGQRDFELLACHVVGTLKYIAILTSPPISIVDSTAFDARAYYEQLITTSSLPVLLRRENELLTGEYQVVVPPLNITSPTGTLESFPNSESRVKTARTLHSSILTAGFAIS